MSTDKANKWFDWENLSENKSNFKIDGYKYKKNKNGQVDI